MTLPPAEKSSPARTRRGHHSRFRVKVARARRSAPDHHSLEGCTPPVALPAREARGARSVASRELPAANGNMGWEAVPGVTPSSTPSSVACLLHLHSTVTYALNSKLWKASPIILHRSPPKRLTVSDSHLTSECCDTLSWCDAECLLDFGFWCSHHDPESARQSAYK